MEYSLITKSESFHVQQNEWIQRTSEELSPALTGGRKLRQFACRGKSYLVRDQEGPWEGGQSGMG